jgi:hypothetical protein
MDYSDGVAAAFCASMPRAATGSRCGCIGPRGCPAAAPTSAAARELLPSARLGALGCIDCAPFASGFGACVVVLSSLLFMAVACCGPGWPAAGLV